MERISRGKKHFIFLTLREAIELHRKGIISLGLFANGNDIQRNGVWKKAQRGEYIDTCFQHREGLSVIYAIEKEGVLQLSDGKQKFTTLLAFINNEFKLGKMRLVDDEDISNKTFSELPEALQEQFLDTELEIKVFEYESDKQVAEIFVKLNGGEKLRPMEKMRANLSMHIPFLGELTKTEYFEKVLKYSKDQRNRYSDVDLALGLIMEEYNPGTDQNKARKEKFAEDLKDSLRLPKTERKRLLTSYLS